MIHMPRDLVMATWLTKVEQATGRIKQYIVGHNGQFIFRIFNKPDGTMMANLLETPPDIHVFVRNKVNEKKGKGYVIHAAWHPVQQDWDRFSEQKVTPFAGLVATWEKTVAKVVLNDDDDFDPRTIRLDLKRTSDGQFRLDQYESTQEDFQQGFPLWQTLFREESTARQVMRDVIAKKEGLGFMAHEKISLTKVSNALADQYPLTSKVAVSFSVDANNIWF